MIHTQHLTPGAPYWVNVYPHNLYGGAHPQRVMAEGIAGLASRYRPAYRIKITMKVR